ncbi:CbtA family protein [Sphingomonas sp. QA11]|uniref:CbtA family protein n=1 Tax=Sphingomonas sp. QA11 TaxID=2950605 RepID=UPI00234B607B|nr:CbtA family protein [Sphingomonas sp. QA11]WCM27974.1 CbtA family protein [Sphingomonas sp. QA11]
MARTLLIRGMLAGVVAALLAVLFARLVAEPQVDLAIAFEAAKSHAMGGMDEPELVSRTVQKGLGLVIAVVLYGAAIGGIFALVFAGLYGRWSLLGPRSLALMLAVAGFVAIALVPALKYPPNPPAVGLHETVAFRTITYFAMIALSVVAMVIAAKLGRGLSQRLGGFNAMLVAGGCYVALVAAVQVVMPVINEVPVDFPAVLLWNFRMASLAMQAVLWAVIGIGFGAAAEHALRRGTRNRA